MSLPKISINFRIGLVGWGHHPDFFTHWLDAWVVGVGFTFARAHRDSVRVRDALRQLSGMQ